MYSLHQETPQYESWFMPNAQRALGHSGLQQHATVASTPPSPPRPRPRAPTPAWPRWPRRTRLWRRWRRCFGRLVVDSAATSSVHIRSPCCTTVSCLFRNFRQHFLKRGYFAILDFQPYYNIACILYTVELYTLHNYC